MKTLLLLLSSLFIISSFSAGPAYGSGILWGVMDWMNNANAYPDTDASTARPLFTDGNAHMITHQYQGANWLSFKVSQQNKDEVERIYDAGHCINLMLYFVSCTYDAQTDTLSYPLTDQFLDDFADLVDAYKVGGGPLYIQAFPEFELWYADKSAAHPGKVPGEDPFPVWCHGYDRAGEIRQGLHWPLLYGTLHGRRGFEFCYPLGSDYFQ